MTPEQLLSHVLTGPEDVGASGGLKFLAVDGAGRIVEIPGAFMANDFLTDGSGLYLFDIDV